MIRPWPTNQGWGKMGREGQGKRPSGQLKVKRKALGTTQLRVSSVEEQRLRRRAAVSSAKLHVFATNATAIPEPLQNGTETISLEDLASELEVSPERLKPLIDHEYLKVTGPSAVLKPPPPAMAWLRAMMMPLPLRPFLPSQMAADLTGCAIKDLRSLCILYNIPLQADPVFGELMSVSAFHRFFESLHHFREPSRFDRQALLGMLMAAVPEQKRAVKKLTFIRRLEKEISRISRLKEPERTERALDMWEAYSEAKTVATSIALAEGQEAPEIDGMDRLAEVIKGSIGDAFTDESISPEGT